MAGARKQVEDPVKKAGVDRTTPTEGDQTKTAQAGGSDKEERGPGKKGGSGETLREKAVKKIHGEGANPSQLGDPISLEAETSDRRPAPSEEGAHEPKKSKL